MAKMAKVQAGLPLTVGDWRNSLGGERNSVEAAIRYTLPVEGSTRTWIDSAAVQHMAQLLDAYDAFAEHILA